MTMSKQRILSREDLHGRRSGFREIQHKQDRDATLALQMDRSLGQEARKEPLEPQGQEASCV